MNLVLFAMLVFSATAFAKPLKIITTLPELSEIAQEIGGQEVESASLLKGTEDPHFIDAVPSFVRAVADADGVCMVGLSLEVGWMPKILEKSANAQVQKGGKGYCEAGIAVLALDKPTGPIDRSMGDVHPGGNPHFYLSPLALKEGATEISALLSRLRPEKKAEFEKRLLEFQKRMDALYKRINEKLSKSSVAVIEYHKEFTYFLNAYKIRSVGSIEDKPGVPPSAARLAQIAESAKQQKARLAIGAPQSPEKQLRKFSELSGIPFAKLPDMVQVNDSNLNSIEKLQDHLASALIKAK